MVSARTILRKKAKSDMTDIHTNVPSEFASQEVDKLFKKYKAYLVESNELKQILQNELAQDRANTGNCKIVTEIERMERTEVQVLSAARIR